MKPSTVLGKPLSELDTPCLVLNKKRLEANIETMQREVTAVKKQLRPHAKTHKCTKISALQVKHGAAGIAATKVSEAMVLAENGFKNILITSPVVTAHKIEMLMQCLTLDEQLMVVVDNIENATALNIAAEKHHLTLSILIDIDPGVGRTGIAFADILSFANALKDFSHLKLAGIQCYAGNLQHITDYQTRYDASHTIMTKASQALSQLQKAGFSAYILSGSGTGTYDIDLQIPGVTEIQPGSYTVMDTEYYTIGSAEDPQQYTKYQPALTLLTTVISANHHTHVTCDAGWKALYQVPTLPLILHPQGYRYEWGGFGDEHGKITSLTNKPLPKLGDRLELMVAHCDPTINMYDCFYITENNIVVDIWPIDMRGKSQ